MEPAPKPLFSARSVFLAAAIFALAFAFSTQHEWEDYYITYRSSKNLATGHGLVFTPGERLSAFTSPLGTLLPALCCVVTRNASDAAALWIYRVMCLAAFAGGAALIHSTSQRLRHHRAASALLAGWLITDAKSLDFTINGMETGLLLFFLAYAVWSLFAAAGEKRWLHLGLAWGGIMWTRPDGFFYIGALTVGVLLFNDKNRSGLRRAEWLKVHLLAALVCTAVYLPWFIFAWSYYGTPIPHTVIAKTSAAQIMPLSGAIINSLKLPFTAWLGDTPVDAIFAPSYYFFGGWPRQMIILARIFGSLGVGLWLLPFLRWEARVSSFACWVMASYLACRPHWTICPWYVPGLTWLAMLSLGFALSQVLESSRAASTSTKTPRWFSRRGAISFSLGAAFFCLGFGGWLTFESGKQLRLQQSVANGLRRDTGLWLKEHARPGDHVFLEPLGYVGYFSELKTYDLPGLSSDTVVQAARKEGYQWPRVIARLNPEWVVLRPLEVTSYAQQDPSLLMKHYQVAHIFDVSQKTAILDIYGRGFLALDSTFIIFHRTDPS